MTYEPPWRRSPPATRDHLAILERCCSSGAFNNYSWLGPQSVYSNAVFTQEVVIRTHAESSVEFLMRSKNKGREHDGPTSQLQPAHDALLRLAKKPQDACALVAIYDASGNHLEASAVRWFGRGAELRSRAVLSILVAIGRQAGSYDPQSMNASEWVSGVANVEARRLRAALDASGSKGRHTRRAM